MATLIVIRNHRAAAFPVDEFEFTAAEVPRVGDYVHLHEQGRVATVDQVLWQVGAQSPRPTRTRREDDARYGAPTGQATRSAVLVVTGTIPGGNAYLNHNH